MQHGTAMKITNAQFYTFEEIASNTEMRNVGNQKNEIE
jgi:hypothetical protein